MGHPIYKHICSRMQMRSRTMLRANEITDNLIKDDSVLIQLRQDCDACKAQLLEPKLKKALQQVKLKEGTSDLSELPLCTFCGNQIPIPLLKITHGAYSRTFRKDRIERHQCSAEKFLSAIQIFQKVHKIIYSSRNMILDIDVGEFR